jgi:hypothetical protein
MDESPRQLIRATRLPLAAQPGSLEREDYERCGVCNIFVAVEPLAGKRLVRVTERQGRSGLGDIFGRDSSPLWVRGENHPGNGQLEHAFARVAL